VMYQYHDKPTEDMMNNEGFIPAKGSFSDIAMMEHMGVKGFNFGTGYYDNHGKESHAIESHVLHNVKLFKQFYDKYKNTALPHQNSNRYQDRSRQSSLRITFSDFSMPQGEEYADYMGTMDPSPKDPKSLDDQQDESSVRKDLEKMYMERGLHETVMMPQTDRPTTPYASLKFADLTDDALKLEPRPETRHELFDRVEFEAINEPTNVGKIIEIATKPLVNGIPRYLRYTIKDDDGGEWYVTEERITHNYSRNVTASLPFHTDIRLHKPNSMLVQEGVFDALTFEEGAKSGFMTRHELRDDYLYQPPKQG